MDFRPLRRKNRARPRVGSYMRVRGAIVAACLLFAAFDTGVVELPLPDEAWQRQAAARISCNVAAVESVGLPEAEALRLVERHCR